MFASATTTATTTTRVLLSLSSSSSSSSKRRMHYSTPRAAVSDNDNDEKISTTKNNAARLTIATTAAFLSLTSSASSVHAAVECNLITPCTNPPPNGEPRYILPGSQYDPAKAAEEAYVRALEAKKSKVPETTLLEAPAVEITKTD